MEEISQTAARNPYAPSKATVADVTRSEARAPRPATVSWAVALLCLGLARDGARGFLTWRPSGGWWVMVCITFAFEILLTYQISAGRNWARWVMLVTMPFATFQGFAWLGPFFAHYHHAVTFLFVVPLKVVALLLLFVSPGRRWFRRPG